MAAASGVPPAALPVVGQQFCAPYVVPLTVTKKAISLSDGDFAITDANGAVVLKVKGAIFSIRNRRVLLDAAGQPLLSMQEKVGPAFQAYVAFHVGHAFLQWASSVAAGSFQPVKAEPVAAEPNRGAPDRTQNWCSPTRLTDAPRSQSSFFFLNQFPRISELPDPSSRGQEACGERANNSGEVDLPLAISSDRR